MFSSVAGRSVLVTGGTKGIGKGIARVFAISGANVVITGRDAHPALVELADTVTEMRKVKHAYDSGIQARRGLEF